MTREALRPAAPPESRQRLLEAAAAVFAEAGFRGATTRRIAEAAGVNEVTLFRLFGSKSQLMSEAFECVHPTLRAALPARPGSDVEAELVTWAEAHLLGMRQIRHLIRKTMAELEEHPEMSEFVCDAKTPYFNQLVSYATRVRQPTNAAEREETRTACTMLSSALFADALGREVVPTAYPSPPERAARKYVQLFLKMLGATPSTRPRRRRSVARARST
ncbi:MAG: TetR/AcrR family transcriptional regulator [Gemmatimonadaceae bacterium]|nr:TetR/AcrR family transcriptional regulator [Gemmatimonadaceae bacterium]